MNLSLWKKRKKELKLRYEDISQLSGIPLTTVKYIFLGYVETPRIDTVQAIERALGIATDEYAAGAQATAMRRIDSDQNEILDMFEKIQNIFGKEKGTHYAKSVLQNIIDNFEK